MNSELTFLSGLGTILANLLYSVQTFLRLRQQYLMQTSQLLPKNMIFPLFNYQMSAQTQGMYDK